VTIPTEPTFVTIGTTEVFVSRQYPAAWEFHRDRATLFEDLTGRDSDGALFVAGVRTEPASDLALLLALRYAPSVGGFAPGILVVPETNVAFIGAGTTLLSYQIGSIPRRIWSDWTELGFWSWRRHGATVVMSAELELAAWDIDGRPLWRRPVEPPWTYEVTAGRVMLDVMGEVTRFDLRDGPPR
jgi:hypothetical protein